MYQTARKSVTHTIAVIIKPTASPARELFLVRPDFWAALSTVRNSAFEVCVLKSIEDDVPAWTSLVFITIGTPPILSSNNATKVTICVSPLVTLSKMIISLMPGDGIELRLLKNKIHLPLESLKRVF